MGVCLAGHHPAASTSPFTSFTSFTPFDFSSAQDQKPPVFRSRIDLMQLDVTVLDRDGRPVRGLTKEDFSLLEDRTPQTIQGFAAIDVPERVAERSVWASSVSRDVVTNDIDNARVFVIVIDDARSMGVDPVTKMPDLWAIREMKKSAAYFIERLGPADLAALVFTNQTRLNQNLTNDHARLHNTVAAYPEDGGGILMPAQGSKMPPCLGHKYAVGAIEGVVKALATLPDRRKSIVYFGGHLPWADRPGPEDDLCLTYWRWRDVFADAQQANVTINPVQTLGLRGASDHYRVVADYTGGHAVVGSNDFLPGLRRIYLESSSYYLLAYQPTKDIADGTFRRLTITVRNRPDVEIVARRNYWAPRARPADAPPREPPPPEVQSMSGLLPTADLKLRATAAAFAIAGTERAVVALAMGVKQPALASRTPDQVEVLIRAFTADGDPRGADTQTIPITVPAARGGAETSRYDVLARLELPKPGKYEVRLSAHSGISNTRGSVYVDVEVPDFRRDPLSLSGVVMNALMGGGPVAPARLLNDLTPVVPTTERTFSTADLVTAFVRIYQGGNGRLSMVTVRTRVLDAAGNAVSEKSDTLDAARFMEARAADHQFRVPVGGLVAGEHVLMFEATLGKVTVKRDVMFEIK
jgi:VWFA-related protein